MKPGDVALLMLCRPRLGVRAVLIRRVWKTLAGSERVEIENDAAFRPGTSFDRRQLLSLDALETLSDRGLEEHRRPLVAAPAE